jgi:hypothetical protein
MRIPSLVGLSLLAFLTPASATAAADAPATCLGQTATIVAGFEQQVMGTEGPDVIVSAGGDVDAGGGDDLVCITQSEGHVLTGAGDDLVTSEALGFNHWTYVELGEGADQFHGGGADDTVYADSPEGEDTDRDEIRTAAGVDIVYSGGPSTPNSDAVRTGPGEDRVVMVPPSAEGTLHPGDGHDLVSFDLTTPTPTDWEFDVATRTIARAGLTWTWSATIEVLGFVAEEGAATASSLAVTGSAHADAVILYGGGLDSFDTSIRLRGDRDTLYLAGRHHGNARYELGAGSDTLNVVPLRRSGLWIRAGETVRVDLATDHVDYGPDTTAAVIAGTENVTATGAHVRIAGDHQDNQISVDGCDVRVHAGSGDDLVIHNNLRLGRCAQTSSIDGGPGSDLLTGGDRSADLLTGGPGRDTADGRGGTDTCRAEVTRHCERS